MAVIQGFIKAAIEKNPVKEKVQVALQKPGPAGGAENVGAQPDDAGAQNQSNPAVGSQNQPGPAQNQPGPADAAVAQPDAAVGAQPIDRRE